MTWPVIGVIPNGQTENQKMTTKFVPLHSTEAKIGLLMYSKQLATIGETKQQAVRLDALCPDTFAEAEAMYTPTKHDLKEKQS